jgi:hypothetical protein
MMEGQLQQWEARLQTIQSISERAGAAAKKELLSELDQLENLYSLGKQQLKSLENIAAETWNNGMNDVVLSWNKVSGAFEATWVRVQNIIR